MQLDHWTCPYCDKSQVLGKEKKQFKILNVDIADLSTPDAIFLFDATGCANPDCLRLSASVSLMGDVAGTRKRLAGATLLPKGSSKPQPDYIPAALREDYEEACAIRDLSPKASATLVRRCLQGMVREFCGISGKRTLYDEIKVLKEMVDSGSAPSGVTAESVDAIDQIRGIGNIGAHMEHDINLIVDVDPGEAQVLIELVEMLFAEWYVARHQRQERLAAIKRIAADKQEARNPRLATGEP